MKDVILQQVRGLFRHPNNDNLEYLYNLGKTHYTYTIGLKPALYDKLADSADFEIWMLAWFEVQASKATLKDALAFHKSPNTLLELIKMDEMRLFELLIKMKEIKNGGL